MIEAVIFGSGNDYIDTATSQGINNLSVASYSPPEPEVSSGTTDSTGSLANTGIAVLLGLALGTFLLLAAYKMKLRKA